MKSDTHISILYLLLLASVPAIIPGGYPAISSVLMVVAGLTGYALGRKDGGDFQ